MGLSSLPSPSEGVLCVLLVNTALTFSIVKGILRSILHIVGNSLSSALPSSPPPPPFDYTEDLMETERIDFASTASVMEEFRSRTPTTRFDKLCSCEWPDNECSVCLTSFEPESEINCLSCGHLFHKVCLEKWLDYWKITCPLCRSSLIPNEDMS